DANLLVLGVYQCPKYLLPARLRERFWIVILPHHSLLADNSFSSAFLEQPACGPRRLKVVANQLSSRPRWRSAALPFGWQQAAQLPPLDAERVKDRLVYIAYVHLTVKDVERTNRGHALTAIGQKMDCGHFEAVHHAPKLL